MNNVLIISTNTLNIINIFNYLKTKINANFRAIIITENKEVLLPIKSCIIKTENIYDIDISIIEKIIMDEKIDIIISSSEIETKSIISKLAVKLESGVLTDCYDIVLKDNIIAYKYALPQDCFAEVISKSKIKIITLNIQNTVLKYENLKNETIIILPNLYNKSNIIEKIKTDNQRGIEFSKKVIGIGRGVKPQDIDMIKQFAKKIDATIGYTRPVVYDGIGEKESQIGISGKIIAPDLYIAIGISGKEYHIKGVEKAKKIIAVNNDINAPIKKHSDYFICDDYKHFLKVMSI